MMELDLFVEFAAPPFGGRDSAAVYEDSIALARAADELGFGALWSVEHHFLGDYSHAAAPDMLLAAIARETRRIGLGFGIVPLPIHDPVRVAERFATLDLLSGGRLLWGVGRGVTVTELEGFGIDPSQSRSEFARRFQVLRSLLENGGFTRDGTHYELQPNPRNLRRDGWLAAVSPDSFDLAATLGLNVMAGPFKPWPMVRADLARYRRARPDGQTSFTIAAYCDRDGAAARRRAGPGLVWAYGRILEISRPLLTRQIAGYEHYRRLGRLSGLLQRTISLPVLEALGLAVVGTPARVARRLVHLRDAGIDRVSLVIGGGDLTVAESTRCLELIAGEVVPALAAASVPRRGGKEKVPA